MRFIVLMLLAIACTATALTASVTTYTNLSAYSAATDNTGVVSFNGLLASGTQFKSFPTLVVDGVTFTTTPGTFVNVTAANYYSPNIYPNAFITNSSPMYPTEILNITLPSPTLALALDYGQVNPHGIGTITLSNGFKFDPATLPTAGNTAFVGFVSTTPIWGLSYVVSGGDWVVQDLRISAPAANGSSPQKQPVLTIAKSHAGSFTAGQQDATYSITVSNVAGAAPTSGMVTVTDSLPGGLTLGSMGGLGWNCSANICSRSDALKAGSSYSPITVTVSVDATATSPQVNQASVSGGGSASAAANDVTTIAGGKVETATIVSAANPTATEIAPGSLATAYGTDLAKGLPGATSLPLPTKFGGTSVSILDTFGTATFAPLLYVTPTQVNFEVPAGTAAGAAQVIITSGDGIQSIANLQIGPVAPGLFELNSKGLAAAYVILYHANGSQTVEPVYKVSAGAVVATPVSLGSSTDQAYLFLFGTGFEAAGTAGVTVSIGGTNAPVAFAGSQGGFAGLDQANVQLPASLKGKGNVTIQLTANGLAANAVNFTIQ